jgi:hypothetical protein
MRKRNVGIAVGTILILSTTFMAGIYLKTDSSLPSSRVQFDFNLSVNQNSGAILQGNSAQTNLTINCIQGSPENVNLSASSGPDGTIFNFSNSEGTPTASSTFKSTLSIDVPISALFSPKTSPYQVNITATAKNGKTYSATYNLTVLNSSIEVSGSFSTISSDSIFPINLKFINTGTNSTYFATLNYPKLPSAAMLQQTADYTVSLPNQQSYNVIGSWARFFGPWSSPTDIPNGTFDCGTLNVNCGVGVNSMTQDYSK